MAGIGVRRGIREGPQSTQSCPAAAPGAISTAKRRNIARSYIVSHNTISLQIA